MNLELITQALVQLLAFSSGFTGYQLLVKISYTSQCSELLFLAIIPPHANINLSLTKARGILNLPTLIGSLSNTCKLSSIRVQFLAI